MANLKTIAREAHTSVRDAYYDLLMDNGYDTAVYADEMPEELADHGLYLYVAKDGDWAIDHHQCFSRFHVYAHASIGPYNITTLYHTLRDSADFF